MAFCKKPPPKKIPPGKSQHDLQSVLSADVERVWGLPKNKELTKEELLKLIKMIEGLKTDEYVLLKHSLTPKHYAFSPYSFQIIDIKNRKGNYYTMSRNGLLHFTPGGSAEFTSMASFKREMCLYDKVRKIPFFAQFIVWKTFVIWKHNVQSSKFKKIKVDLEDSLFATKRPLRKMMIELVRMCEKVSSMGFLTFRSGTTYNLNDFLSLQEKRLIDVGGRLRHFEEMVIEMALSACRSCLIDENYSLDEYSRELEFYLREQEIPMDNLVKKMTVFNYPGQWMSYSKGARKRKICERLTNFIHLIDYLVQRAYHSLLKNSMYALMSEMDAKIDYIEEEYQIPTRHREMMDFLREDHEKYDGGIPNIENSEPLFYIGCGWTQDELLFFPSTELFRGGFRSLFESWKKEICLYPNLLPNEKFNPFSKPIVNGYMNQKTVGEGPSMEFLLENDDLLGFLSETIDQILIHGFMTCTKYFANFEDIRAFCTENELIDLEDLKNETDVKKFAHYLEKFNGQLDIINSTVEDDKKLGVFQVNNGILKEHALPTVFRCLQVIHETLPQFGGRTVKDLRSKMQMDQETLERSPENVDEWMEFIVFLDSIVETIDDIEKEVDICGEIYDLIELYDIPGNEEDFKDFIDLQPNLLQLRGVIDKKTLGRKAYVTEFFDKLQNEIEKIYAEMRTIRSLLEDPSILMPNPKPESVRSSMNELLAQLRMHKENADKFNSYQKTLKFLETDFQELEDLIELAVGRNHLWEFISDLYLQEETWLMEPFRKLDPERMSNEIDQYEVTLSTLSKGLPSHNEVIPHCQAKLVYLRSLLPNVTSLRNPNMRKRHWDTLEKTLHLRLVDELITLKNLIDAGVTTQVALIKEISEKSTAEAEFNLESLLRTRSAAKSAAKSAKTTRGSKLEELKSERQDDQDDQDSVTSSSGTSSKEYEFKTNTPGISSRESFFDEFSQTPSRIDMTKKRSRFL